MKNTVHTFGLAAAALLAASGANAAILVDQLNPYAGYSVGGSDWGAFTSALAAQGGYEIGSVSNAAQVAAADAILIVARSGFEPGAALTATEQANLTSFLATGKRVVIVGDGVDFIFGEFTDSAVAFASGGTASATYFVSTTATALPGDPLTSGVTSVLLQGAATVNGGTALFTPNWATLWGDNLLTVLDVNALTASPGPAFRDNIASWLGASQATAPVPEPASWAMMMLGFGLAGFAMRRRSVRTTLRFA